MKDQGPSFLCLPSADVDNQLLLLRRARVAVSECPFVLAAYIGERSGKGNKNQADLDSFREIFNRHLPEDIAIVPADTNLPTNIHCAWFPSRTPFQALVHLIKIQQEWLRSRRGAAIFSIAETEYGAFRLLRSAGSDQIVIDRKYWNALPSAEHQLAAAINVHLADSEERGKLSSEAVRSAVNDVVTQVENLAQSKGAKDRFVKRKVALAVS